MKKRFCGQFGSFYWFGNTLRLDYISAGKRQRPVFGRNRTGSATEKRLLETSARKKLNEIELAVDRGELFDSDGKLYPTYEQMALWYWEKHQSQKEYMKRYNHCYVSDWSKLKFTIGYFGDIPGNKIKREDVKNFRMYLREYGNSKDRRRKWSEAYINRIIAAVGQVYSRCITQEIWRFQSAPEIERLRYGNIDTCVNLTNPIEGLPKLTETPRKPIIPTMAQFRTLLNTLLPIYREMAIVGVHTGLRRRNIVELKVSEVDLVQGEIRIESHKGGGQSTKKRLHPEALAAITARIHENAMNRIETLYVFAKPDGNYYRDFYGHWRAAGKEAGLKGFWFEHLRPTYTSWRVEEGVSMPLLQRALDHSTSATTARYYNQTAEATTEIMKTQRAVLEPVGCGSSCGSFVAASGNQALIKVNKSQLN